MADTLLVDAMNYIGEIFKMFLAPGSPPETGPLSTIDEWGEGLMDTFNGSITGDSAKTLQQKLTEATRNVLSIRQQIIDAEKAGYVPPELKEKLRLAEEEKKSLEGLVSGQKDLNKEQAKAKPQKQAGGSSGGGAGAGSGNRDRVTAEKKTAQEIRDSAIAVLEQQLKDGTIRYEDYVKEKLKIETKFYEDSLQAGDKVNQGTINNIKDLQAEVDKITAKAPKEKKQKGGIGLGDLGLSVDDFLPKPIEIQKSVSEAVTKIAETAVTTLSTKVKESGTKLQTSLVDMVVKGFQKVREYVTSLATEEVFPFTVIAGFLASPLVSGAGALFSSIGSAVGTALSAIGGLGAVLQILLKYVFKFSVYGLLIYGIFTNWDEIVKDVKFIWGALTVTIQTSIKNITDFISALKKAKGSDTIITNITSGFSLLALTATNILGLIKKVVKVVLIGGIVGGFTLALNAVNEFTNKFFTSFGGVDKFAQDLVSTTVNLSTAFRNVAKNVLSTSDAFFRGDFVEFMNQLRSIPDSIKSAFLDGTVSKFFTDTGNAIRSALPPSVITFFDTVSAKISSVLAPTIGALQPVMLQFSTLWTRLQTTFTQLTPLLLTVGAIIGGILVVALGLVADVILSVLQTLPDIAPFFVRAFGGVTMIITGIVDIFNGLVLAINAGWALIQGDTTTAGNLISQAFLSIQVGITELFGGLYTTVVNLGAGILVAVESFALNFVTNILTALGMDQYASYFTGIKTGFVELLNGLAQDATNIVTGLVDQMTKIFTLLYNRLIGQSIIPDMITGILNAFNIFDTDLGRLISATVQNVLGFFTDLGGKIVGNITSSLSSAGGSISALISGLFSGGTSEQSTTQPTTIDTSGLSVVGSAISQLLPTVTNSVIILQDLLNTFISGTVSLLISIATSTYESFVSVNDILIGENSY
ncbi:MAG: hypothetical protein HC874_31215 [Richelia sp. SL_2_1]|nr:hypothetical protein [Richelia sp. SL_2_1]